MGIGGKGDCKRLLYDTPAPGGNGLNRLNLTSPWMPGVMWTASVGPAGSTEKAGRWGARDHARDVGRRDKTSSACVIAPVFQHPAAASSFLPLPFQAFLPHFHPLW